MRLLQVEEDFQLKFEADSKAEQPIVCKVLDNVPKPALCFPVNLTLPYASQCASLDDCKALGMDKLKAELGRILTNGRLFYNDFMQGECG